MSKPPPPAIYMDSCAFIVAHKYKQWRRLAGHFRIHTTSECWKELGRGDKSDPDYVFIDLDSISSEVEVHTAEKKQLIEAQMRAPKVGDIHDGEKELLAWCAAQKRDSLLLTTGDKAAILAACELGLLNRLISLEELLEKAGHAIPLPKQYTKRWLTSVITEYHLASLANE